MAINVKCVQRSNPNDRSIVKWYPIQKMSQLLDENEVAEYIADETTLNPSEAMMAIRQLYKIVSRELLNGNTVKLGNLGTFSVSLTTTGAESKSELTANNIEKVNLRFIASSKIKEALQNAKFTWINRDDEEAAEDASEEASEDASESEEDSSASE